MLRNAQHASRNALTAWRSFSAVAQATSVPSLAASAQSRASDFEPRIADLSSSRALLRLAGSDLLTFLQGLVTNDVAGLEAPGAPPMYTAILNAQGRFLYDLFLHRQPGDGPVLLADVDRESMPELVKLLNRYKLRARVDVADVSGSNSVCVQFGVGGKPKEEWPADARLPALGRRAIVDGEPLSSEAAPIIYSRQYRQWRIEHGVAEGPAEIPAGEAIPLEYNLDGLQGVSFEKGCYVGQELVARTHWSGAVRKRLMPLALRPPEPIPIGMAIEAEGGGKRPPGTIRVLNSGSGRGLALMRLQQGLAAAHGQLPLHVKDRPYVHVQPWRPSWWPVSWSGEAVVQ